MDKEKAIMEVLYSKYGSILEKYGYKPNKAQLKLINQFANYHYLCALKLKKHLSMKKAISMLTIQLNK